jgi:putative DNA-invertase from lambdoid prophage Rac
MTFMDGQRPKSNRFTPKVLALVADDRSYRLIDREFGPEQNTVRPRHS